ncbi:hypothetical protein [Ligilactobacillus acidipiscis]|jgi:hypothetical protein|uniref:Uncharacterized protein n=1 Tax=Ligilactobacillus acidipiscis TaxID=89059 RepID=A0A1K1KKU2_9LACO|nr:hypothetical protein [Ligilactobacillus acidipiscis]SFV39532.1 hypothetical protein LAC1533_0112 [Ligilactobacillus acidipiscis]
MSLTAKASTEELVETVMDKRSCSYQEAILFLLRYAQKSKN